MFVFLFFNLICHDADMNIDADKKKSHELSTLLLFCFVCVNFLFVFDLFNLSTHVIQSYLLIHLPLK